MRHDENFEEILKQNLPSASAEQGESAGKRVFQRLQANPGAMPDPAVVHYSPSIGTRWRMPLMAAAAAILIGVVWVAVRPDDAPLDPVDSVGQGITSKSVATEEIVRSSDTDGATFQLADGSGIEMRPGTELSVEHLPDGVRLNLRKGGVIVNAAKQQSGRHLYVRTKDVTASVAGTVSLNAETEGSRVTVIEGEALVRQEGTEKKVLPGEQLATSPSMTPRLVEESLGWSRKASSHLARMEQSAMTIALVSARTQEPMRPANTPKWEVVSIRPCGRDAPEPGARGGDGTAPGGGMATRPGGLLRVVCVPVKWLIERAYVKWIESDTLRRPWYFPITGGPSWIDTDAYSIEARAEGQPTAQEMRGPMLQVILEERFSLKIRREIREEPVYELRIAEGGFKLQPLKDGECEARKTGADRVRSENAGKTTLLDLIDGRPVINIKTAESMQCGFNFYGARDGSEPPPGAGTFTLSGASMSELIRYLDLDRIILDKTGIQGQFDIELTYGRYNSPMREPRSPLPDGVVPGGDTVFDALRKQLGLTLVRARGPRIYYTVESISRPTPN